MKGRWFMPKRYKNTSVPRNKRLYDESSKTIVEVPIPDLNGIKEYSQPVHGSLDKTSVCKYCSKNLVRGYICYDCRELETPVKRQSFEERQAIEEGLRLMKESRARENFIRQDDMANNTIERASVLETKDNFCKTCGLNIAPTLRECEFCN